MKVSLNLLKKYLDLKNLDIETLTDKLSFAGFEVEEVIPCAQATKLKIGKVIECKNHPDSDHLHVTKVDIGNEILQIVCGAPNVKEGIKVIVCLVGCKLKALDLEIKDSVIRNVESHGMIASLKELGVSEKSLTEEQKEGIEILPDEFPVGADNVLELLGLDDVILDIYVTPNRSDVLGYNSLIKELAAILNCDYKLDNYENVCKGKNSFIATSATKNCDYFSVTEIKNIKIKESPIWMQEILKKHDIKVINNIVDIGNYVTLMTGQPVHMYDADKLKSKKFVVRDDFSSKILALDGKEYEIIPNDLVVSNNNEVVCIAGIIGSEHSKVDENTKNIALEAALFNGVLVNNSAKRLNMMTTAATNYSKKVVDRYKVIDAVVMATSLMKKYADAKVISKIYEYDKRHLKNKTIKINPNFVNSRLGTNYSLEQLLSVFKRLSFSYSLNKNNILVTVPTYRNDITVKEDLVEEIVRLIGFETVPFVLDNVKTDNVGLTSVQKARQLIKNYLLDIGLDETLTYTLVSKYDSENFEPFEKDAPIKLPHPLTVEKEYLRRSLLKSMLNTIFYNQGRGTKNVGIFEISKVYSQNYETEKLSIAISGDFNKTLWLNNHETNFYLIKGIVEGLLNIFGIEPSRYTFERIDKYYPNQTIYHFGRSAVLKINGQIMGMLGELHPKTLKEVDIANCLYFELDLNKFLALKTSKIKFTPVSKFPPISRDIAIIVKKDVVVNDLLKLVKKVGGTLLNSVDVFDVYEGEHVESGYKSVALTMTFVDINKTLKDEEVNNLFEKIYLELQKSYSAKIRS